MSNPLYDVDFLAKLHKERNRIIYARITALSWDENPLERIEGQITGGSINIDGSSAVRRSCSLTLVAKDININNYLWGLSTKFKLEVGLKNNIIDSGYPDVIWFPQGTYVIASFSSSINANNYTISISGKDKMCMLNGDMGGSLYASIDFGIEEYYDKKSNTTTYNSIPVKTIIRNAVNVYGNEPLHNIIINDIDDYGVELLEYRGDDSTPLFLFREVDSDIYVNMSMNQKQICWVQQEDGDWKQATISTIEDVGGVYDSRINAENVVEGSIIRLTNNADAINYKLHKIVYGETVGYRLTDVTYAGDLISSVGESLTSILDKIKTMLGDFEYFYDVYGRFIFQKKKTYVTNDWNSIIKREDDMYVESAAYTSTSVYTFSDSHYFTTLSHTPTMNNLKNDFSVWGNRKGINGSDLPIHMRYAVDRKPRKYFDYDGNVWLSDELDWTQQNSYYDLEEYEKYHEQFEATQKYDWRELIYRMGLDYFEHHDEDDYLHQMGLNNPNDYPLGYTGYEIYYTDLEGFWRELYNPTIYNTKDNKDIEIVYGTQYYSYDGDEYTKVDFDDAIALLTPTVGQFYYKLENGKYVQYVGGEDFSFTYGQKYYIKDKENEEYTPVNIYTYRDNTVYYWQQDTNCDIKTFWNFDVNNNPAVLNFWFDFIGEGSELDKYMVCNIGDRSKSVNDSKVTGIYFKETPSVLFITNDEYIAMANKVMKTGYTYIRTNDSLNNFFSISAQGKSAQDVVEELLYNNTYCNETITISSVPVYHLQPNTRIEVHDRTTQIEGEYLVSRISLPLTYNGTMSITATKAVDTIY